MQPGSAQLRDIMCLDACFCSVIELSIFASHYSTEIASIDVETGRIDRFGSDSNYSSRCILLYSGIHYDAVSLAPMPDAPEDFHETKFDVSDQTVLDGASKLADALRAKKAYTNTATFDLKCQVSLCFIVRQRVAGLALFPLFINSSNEEQHLFYWIGS